MASHPRAYNPMDDLRLRLAFTDTGWRLTATGHIDDDTAYLLTEVTGAALARYPAAAIVIDLAAVTFIDHHGVAALASCRRTAIGYGARLTIVNPQPLVVAAIEASGHHRLLHRTRPRRYPRRATHLPRRRSQRLDQTRP